MSVASGSGVGNSDGRISPGGRSPNEYSGEICGTPNGSSWFWLCPGWKRSPKIMMSVPYGFSGLLVLENGIVWVATMSSRVRTIDWKDSAKGLLPIVARTFTTNEMKGG